MKLGERTFENSKIDYWFLRNNGVYARTALKILGMSYGGAT